MENKIATALRDLPDEGGFSAWMEIDREPPAACDRSEAIAAQRIRRRSALRWTTAVLIALGGAAWTAYWVMHRGAEAAAGWGMYAALIGILLLAASLAAETEG